MPIVNCSGTASRPITYTEINYGDIDTSSGGYGPQISANYIVFSGLQITGSDPNADTQQYESTYPIELLNTTGSVIKNCSITNNDWTWRGVWINGAQNCKVYNNLISFPGVKTYNGASDDSPGINDDGYVSGVSSPSGTGNWVVNNTIHDCSGPGYESPEDETGRYLQNNIFLNVGWCVHAGNTGITHSNNIFWNYTYTTVLAGNDSTYVPVANEVVENPMVNADFTLQSASPAIDAGCYVGLPFQGKWPDIGAFEYAGSAQPTLGTVTGWVKNPSGTAISGALVTAGADANVWTTTNSSGNYTLINVPEVSMTMSASAAGHATVTQTPNLAASQVVNFTLPLATQVTRISAAKALANSTAVQITAAKIVTVSSGVFAGNAIYIEESDRTCGIKVVLDPGQSVTAGNSITLTGTLATDANGERYIQCTSIDSNDGSTTALSGCWCCQQCHPQHGGNTG